ncbi:MAG: hypothetical protein JSR85_01015 [Proteobacteria bacterium]|nr:hypothetical protein [Pseudomonadota bacterium]
MNSLNLKAFLTTTAFAFLATSCLFSFAFAGSSEDRDAFIPVPSTPVLKREAEEDKNSSKRIKLSPPEKFDIGEALVALPDTAIYVLSTFLNPVECFNLALTCKALGKHLPHLPMWQNLLERSGRRSPADDPEGFKCSPDDSKFSIFQRLLTYRGRANLNYAQWLLAYDLNRKLAKRELKEILKTAQSPQSVLTCIGLMKNFDIGVEKTFIDAFEKIPMQIGGGIPRYLKSIMIIDNPDESDTPEVRAAYNLLVAISQSSSSPVVKAEADYHRSRSRYYEFIKEELLPDQEAYTLLVQLSQNKHLSPYLRDQVNFRRAQMRFQNRIGDDRLSLSDVYDLFTQVSQSPTFRKKYKIIANSCRARVRLKDDVGDDRLTLLDAYRLLDGIPKDNSHSYLRRYAGALRATMRFRSLIGDDLLTLCKAYHLWEDQCRNGSISTCYYTDCSIEYDEIVDSSVIYQMLFTASQNPELSPAAKAETDFCRAEMRAYKNIGDDRLSAQEAYQILLEASQNPELPIERAEVDLCRARLRIDAAVGDERLTVQETYRMLDKIMKEDEKASMEALYLRDEMKANSDIGPALLNSGDITPWEANLQKWYTGPRVVMSWFKKPPEPSWAN